MDFNAEFFFYPADLQLIITKLYSRRGRKGGGERRKGGQKRRGEAEEGGREGG